MTIEIYSGNQDTNLPPVLSDGNIISRQFGAWHSHIGESEMISGKDAGIFAKAISDVKVLALSVDRYREILMNDKKFLRNALERQTALLFESVTQASASLPLEERVLNAMMYRCPNGILKGVELYATVFHCSARQLQRILNQLILEHKIEKIGKGQYRCLQN